MHAYGLIFVDPPTFSNAKGREHVFDLQRDYIELVNLAAERLEADGILIFANNFRRFKMNHHAFPSLNIADISASTIPKDFARNPRIHRCWKITRN
jgi:23S rRNA (guanine2445-N2)-methyltransferase / 23S rRNA (guanine2069-N7)-methyltransferase